MKPLIAIIFTLLVTGVYAQEQPVCTKGKDALTPEKQFEADLKSNNLKIYTVGGLKPYDHEAVQVFENTHGIHYHDFGCLAPSNMDYYAAYNLLVFQYLKEKSGNEWEKEIKDNAMGFYKWKEAK
jgi:hypothetical protein